jgi:hypothetical protein
VLYKPLTTACTIFVLSISPNRRDVCEKQLVYHFVVDRMITERGTNYSQLYPMCPLVDGKDGGWTATVERGVGVEVTIEVRYIDR